MLEPQSPEQELGHQKGDQETETEPENCRHNPDPRLRRTADRLLVNPARILLCLFQATRGLTNTTGLGDRARTFRATLPNSGVF